MGELSSSKMIGGSSGSRAVNYDDDLIDAPFSPPTSNVLIGYGIPARKSKFKQLQQQEEVPAVIIKVSSDQTITNSKTTDTFELPSHIAASSRFHEKRGSDSFLLTQHLAMGPGPGRGGQSSSNTLYSLGENEASSQTNVRNPERGYKNISEWKPNLGSNSTTFFQGFYKGPDRSKLSNVEPEEVRPRSTSDSIHRPPDNDMRLGIPLTGTTTVSDKEIRQTRSADVPSLPRTGSWFGSMFSAAGGSGNVANQTSEPSLPASELDTTDFVKPTFEISSGPPVKKTPEKPKKVKKRDVNMFAPTSL